MRWNVAISRSPRTFKPFSGSAILTIFGYLRSVASALFLQQSSGVSMPKVHVHLAVMAPCRTCVVRGTIFQSSAFALAFGRWRKRNRVVNIGKEP